LKPKGLRTANGVTVMGSRLWNYGIRYHRKAHGIDINPFAKMGLERPPVRSVRWTMEEVDVFVAKADEIGAHSIGTAALICYLFNQRVTDAITIVKSAWDGEALTIRQSKRGRLVQVAALPEFKERMKRLVAHEATQIVIDERSGLPYTQYSFSHRAAEVRELAGLPSHLQARDLRRTGTTETRAAAAIHELQATTGNNLESLQIYSVSTDGEAKSAMEKRHAFRTKRRQESK
jgi:hypothetical protein